MSLPHIQNSQAGINKYDPVHQSLFEVYFTIPEALRAEFGQDEAIITQHVQKISGFDQIDKSPEAGEQKFMGTSRSYLKPKMDQTHVEFEVELSLNLRNGVDNYIYNLFKAWAKLCYDYQTGQIVLKKDYCADWVKLSIANRVGDVFRQVIFKDVMLVGGISGWTEENYDSNDAFNITVKFRSDWWSDISAKSTQNS